MNEGAERMMRACTKGSMEGDMPFPEVVARLAEIGCEQYHADFRRQEKIYYMPDGEWHAEPLPLRSQAIEQGFSAEGIIAALRAIQARRISYAAFLEQIMAAGCVGYFVYITGRCAIYLGRQGEFHVEQFPAPAPTASS